MTIQQFDDIFNANWVRIVMYAKNQLNNHDFNQAEEIAIQVFYSLWKAQPEFENEIAVRGWLYIATKRRCINSTRRDVGSIERYTDNMPEYPLSESDHKEIELFDMQSELLERIAKSKHLSKKESSVFKLYYLKNFTPREIATLTKVTLSTINSQLNTLHNKLRRLLKGKNSH